MVDISKTFWEKWFGADELERVNLVSDIKFVPRLAKEARI